MTDHAALGANPTSKCPKTLDTDEAALQLSRPRSRPSSRRA